VSRFNHSRLDVARRKSGLTKGALADAAGISPRNLTSYKKDEQEPTRETVAALAAAVGFPAGFFYGDDLDELAPEGVSFRSLSSLTARQRDQALGSGQLALLLSDWIEARFELPEPNVPRYQRVDPEVAAEAVREAWGLGEGPLPNLVHLLEAHGVRVFSLAEDSRAVDAYSFWRGPIPYIFLNTRKTAEHSRMDAAHELGHLVLHAHGGPGGREAEQEAYRFGAAFLMPSGSIRANPPRTATVDQLAVAKRRWKVSVASLAYRMHQLGVISDWQYRSIFIDLNRRGRKSEPVAPGHEKLRHETSQVLNKVFHALREDGVSRATVARELEIPARMLNESIFGLVLSSIEGDDPPELADGPAEDRLRLRVV
jgi:Zn-dependent peptidase ImmA (M78 family)/transcriptional regulator with XRE-family HTH domain